MADNELHDTAKALVAEDKGIFAAAESSGTTKKGCDSIDSSASSGAPRVDR